MPRPKILRESPTTSANPAESRFLVADVGGTNTRVALADGAELLPGTIERYRTAEHPGIETVLRRYIERPTSIAKASVSWRRARCATVEATRPISTGQLTGRLQQLSYGGSEKFLG